MRREGSLEIGAGGDRFHCGTAQDDGDIRFLPATHDAKSEEFIEKTIAFQKRHIVVSVELLSSSYMKSLLLSAIAVMSLSAIALADIHDPPMNDYGPTRKLGRGLANVLFGWAEVPEAIAEVNERDGNAAAVTYGVVRGFGRFFFRFGSGVYEVSTHPFPTYRASYRPPYKLQTPWIHGGYEEFPPELGFESRYRYIRTYDAGYGH